LPASTGGGSGGDIPYEIDGYLTEINTGAIDVEYMNLNFEKYFKTIHSPGVSKQQLEEAQNDLHRAFAMLTQEDQKYANLFLNDIRRGDVIVEDGKTFRDYITEYRIRAKNARIHNLFVIFGLDVEQLRKLMSQQVTTRNINEYRQFDKLVDSVDKIKAKVHFEKVEGRVIPQKDVNPMIDRLLREFVLSGGSSVIEGAAKGEK
jgi:type I restriction enzyme R subunit